MPDQRVPAHAHIVGLRKIDQSVGICKVKSGSGWSNGFPLKSILGNDDIEFALYGFAIDRIIS